MRDVIEKRLHEKGLTWYGLVKLLNVVPIVVYRLRDRNSCSIGMLKRLADALEMSIADRHCLCIKDADIDARVAEMKERR